VALSAATLSPLVLADYFAAFPAAAAVVRSNPATGVAPHNPPTAMIEAICSGFATAMTGMVVHDAYAGVVGGTATPTLTVPVFNGGAIASAPASLLGTLGWTGASGAQLLNILFASFFSKVASITKIEMLALPGGGVGVGTVSLAVNPSLAVAMTTACQAAMVSSFTASGYFAISDIPGNGITPQVAAIITGLSSAYGTIVGSVTAAVPYAGAASGSPLAVVNSGKFI